MGLTKPQYSTTTKLTRIAFLSKRDAFQLFNSLMHHFNVDSLKECFNELEGKKAVGIDGVDKEQYRKELDTNLEALIGRMKRLAIGQDR